VQTLPALSLSLASITLPKQLKTIGSATIFSIAGATIIVLYFAFASFIPRNDPLRVGYWKNFFAYASGSMSEKDYKDSFDRNAPKLDMLADYLKMKGSEGNYLYIWGEYAWLYPRSGSINASKYVTSFHVFGTPSGRDELTTDLATKQPLFIIVAPNNIGHFDALYELLDANYKLDIIIDDVEVYRKI
jgi:hypothetical protein